MDNDRPRIELLNALLMTLPGSPIIYYGDEIGMGDNIYLGDRNGVRTPMQWSSDRNAGFSTAEAAALYLPVITDPTYSYQAVNVAAQERTPSSLLNVMKQLIATRKRWPVLGRGSIEFLRPRNQTVLAFLRRDRSLSPAERGPGGTAPGSPGAGLGSPGADDPVLVVANLSDRSQPVELDLSAYAGATPVELLGGQRFPRVGTAPYFVSLGPHGYYWFRLEQREPRPVRYGIEDTVL
jgi:maltose alpha-D-glucosyltransferase/alpha-amylase